MIRLICGTLILSLTLSSCLKRKTQARLKHQFGETSRLGNNVRGCIYDTKKTVNIAADQYLKELAETIGRSNPNTFKGNFSIDKICFYVAKSPKINAFALPGQNEIVFTSQVLKDAKNDADVAGVLSHELAHLTMQAEHFDYPPEILANPEFQKINQDFHANARELKSNLASVRSDLNEKITSATSLEVKFMEQLNDEQKAKAKSIAIQRSNLIARIVNSEGSKTKEAELGFFPGCLILGDDGQTASFTGEDNTNIESEISAHNTDANAFSEELKRIFPIDVEQLLTRYNNILEIRRRELTLEEQKQQLIKDIDNKMSQISPGGRRYNWSEQEADEVGLELYLRSGFKWSSYVWIETAIMGKDESEKCLHDNIEKHVAPTRGTKSHPEDCWRMYNNLVTEAELHKTDYAPFESNNLTEIAPGKLIEIKKNL